MLKLLKNIEIDESKYKNLLLSGDLYGFEESLYKFILTEVYDKLATHLINSVVASEAFEQKMSCLASSQRMGKLQKRSVDLQLRTGTYIKIETQYARKVPKKPKRSRYLAFQYWGVISKASPSYYSQVSKFSVLCNSFAVVKEVFEGLHIRHNLERLRSLTLAVSKKCLSHARQR